MLESKIDCKKIERQRLLKDCYSLIKSCVDRCPRRIKVDSEILTKDVFLFPDYPNTDLSISFYTRDKILAKSFIFPVTHCSDKPQIVDDKLPAAMLLYEELREFIKSGRKVNFWEK